MTLNDGGSGSWTILFDGLPITIDGENVTWTVSETAPENYKAADVEGDEDSGFSITNNAIKPTSTPTEDFEMYRIFDELTELPKTGFSGVKPQRLSVKPADLTYKPLRLILEIPILSVNVDLVQVPYANGEYPIEWLGSSAGLLEGSSQPGQGHAIITAHNHLNTTEAGPFALLQYAKVGDVIFVLNELNERNEMEHFRVYANEKVAKNDIDSLIRIASQSDRSLTLITCEDESIEGGYANRRIIAAAPAGK